MPQLLASGKLYEWTLMLRTSKFPQLARFGEQEEELDVLRIATSDSRFEVVIRVHTGKYSDGDRQFLGAMLVLGGEFPNGQQPITPGILLELRPRLSSLASGEPNSATAERVVQWVSSHRFKPVRVNASGGRWVGYGHSSGA